MKKINQSSEKTTLGELDALSELRAQFEKAESKPAAKAVKETAPAKEEATSTGVNELKDLSGVGPAMIKRLSALGVNTIEDLIAITEEKAAELAEQDSKISAEQWTKWISEAKA